MKDNLDKVYHYCTVETLDKILESKKLRFTDITKLNDGKEYYYAYECFKNALGKLGDCPPKFDFFVKEVLDNNTFFVLCFSELGDSLHMWSTYARSGVNIGFRTEDLNNWISKSIVLASDDLCGDSKDSLIEVPNKVAPIKQYGIVQYDTKDEISREAFTCLTTSKKQNNQYYAFEAFKDFMHRSAFHKSDFWESEQEYRLLFITDYKKIAYRNSDSCDEMILEPANCGNGFFPIVLRYDVPFEKRMIKSICIGPDCNISENDLIDLMFANGFTTDEIAAIEISKSKGSIRI